MLMPFLPALFTVIGIGLQCKKESNINAGPKGQQVVCNRDTTLLDAVQWEREMSSLPPKVSRGLWKYESEMKKHLADYSKFCGMGIHVGESHFLSVYEMDIAKIFCPSEYRRCHGWKHTGRCVKKLCRQLYPMYGRISDGIQIMEMECIQADFSVHFDGNEDDASIERTHRSLE